MIIEAFFNFDAVDPSWQTCLKHALAKMDPKYLEHLTQHTWIPGPKKIFNAFSLPLEKVNYVLFGESPYPRAASANGYAFWDSNVEALWSATGMTKSVNRATSLRNFIKMLLVAEGLLDPKHLTQDDIANIDKTTLIKTNHELFERLINHGFLLLNASLVLQSTPVNKDATAWQPFLKYILDFLYHSRPCSHLILFGNIANRINKLIKHQDTQRLYTEHPYNHSFIKNIAAIEFFKPFHLLLL